MKAEQDSSNEYTPRSAREAAAEIARFAVIFAVITVAVPFLLGKPFGVAPVVAWLVGAGEVLIAQLGWVFGVYVAVLLAFYAVTISGQMTGGIHVAARTRRSLGSLAELLAAGTIPLALLIGTYCTQSPPTWVLFVVLLPVVGIIWFLAAQLGAFIVFDRATRIANANRRRATAEALLKKLGKRSRRASWQVLILNALIISIVAFLISLSVGSIELAALLGACYLVVALGLLGMNTFTLWTIRTTTDRLLLVVTWVAWVALYVSTVLITWVPFLFALGVRTQVGWAFVVLAVATIATTLWPLGHAPRFIVDWTVNGVAARLASRSVEKTLKRANQELADLLASRPPHPGLWQRLRALVRSAA